MMAVHCCGVKSGRTKPAGVNFRPRGPLRLASRNDY
jgi:hypothetical protein